MNKRFLLSPEKKLAQIRFVVFEKKSVSGFRKPWCHFSELKCAFFVFFSKTTWRICAKIFFQRLGENTISTLLFLDKKKVYSEKPNYSERKSIFLQKRNKNF